ncbi:hypothetical protein FSOLCH5_013244 [Fusarium solani]|uniref:Uncharacterized protein n=3 Tax=Fusarium solani species complex TaxID=232080 RepID=A0A9W8R3L6_9HYPO|nr:uncharacterized protein B0J15DRAFT_545844 [Fusarium solani]XP_053008932.1 Hypothetical protein NCS54_00753300 [Fusarium falciforme]UPK91497.1 hypothetical protein LCI18_002432 [Fusarium solani-melongenae]KAH7265815.1 hypothetical protein B0J15DRAFT_545844 [Fusarium solani]KAJ3463572.1 hypothetical protein MRS44_008358 [Fusarium solani]KAJ4157846.1 hypothetical protein NW754_009496 [Fusarium falciforme]KAJ4185869.1 hypothetical protein NW755_008321 [Fusarium falciforme]
MSSHRSSKKSRRQRPPVRELIRSLTAHQVNTLTELRRIERIAASCEDEDDARAFQEPMTLAWANYVTSNQFLIELHGLTPNYPFCGDIVQDAHLRVLSDPESNRSWNTAWLCLVKIRDDGLIPLYALLEAGKQEMWGETLPTQEDVEQLASCFELEWRTAVDTMLRHWATPPTWYGQ